MIAPWPEKPVLHPPNRMRDELSYQRARAEAAISRLKLAVEALQMIGADAWHDEAGIYHPMLRSTRKRFADEALAKIGDLEGK